MHFPLEVMGYVPHQRIDRHDGGFTFRVVHPETEQAAVLKLFNPGEVEFFLQHPGWFQPRHRQVSRIIRSGRSCGMNFILREWVEGWSFQALLEQPPTRERTRRLLAAIYSLTEVVEWLHRPGSRFETAARVHGQIHPLNVIVGQNGGAVLVNAEKCRLATPPPTAGLPGKPRGWRCSYDPLSPDPRPAEVAAVVEMLGAIWSSFSGDCVPFDSLVPAPLSRLRGARFRTATAFRSELARALTEAGATIYR